MLDIIIPTYKNQEGLKNTLRSINQSLLNYFKITVIDDCSGETFDEIVKEFPFVDIYALSKNSGPGIVRQYGIFNTKEPYIMFIDTGDLLISNELQETVLQEINNNPEAFLFSWPHKFESDGTISAEVHNRMHGRIYNRKFIEDYAISFCPNGSYANEDIGFNRQCKLILRQLNDNDKYYKVYQEPLILWTVNENSLTKKNRREFSFKMQNIGLAENEIYLFRVAKYNKIDENFLIDEANEIIAAMHYNVLQTSEVRPEFLNDSWYGAKLFYDNIFKAYEKNNALSLQVCFSRNIKRIRENKLKGKWKKNLPVNIRRFFNDLKQYEQVPEWYKGE